MHQRSDTGADAMKKLFFIALLWLGAMAAQSQPGSFPISCKEVRVQIDVSNAYRLKFKDSTAAALNVLEWFKGVEWLYLREGIRLKPFIGRIYEGQDPVSVTTNGSLALNALSNQYCNTPAASRFDICIYVDLKTNARMFASYGYNSGLIMYCQQFAYLCVPIAENTIPGVYNYTVKTAAHEIGHLFGSKHTQWCGWLHPDGTKHQIDTCSQPESAPGVTCGNIVRRPKKNGTIMSYCENDYQGGIDFNLGFGPLPGAVIRNTLAISTVKCVTTSPPPACTYTYSYGECQPNGTQVATVISATPAGCTGTPIKSRSCTYIPPLPPIAVTDGVIGPVMHYAQGSNSFFRFAIPTTGNWQYEVSYCRFDGTGVPDSITPPAACGVRNALNFSRPSAAQFAAAQINLQAIPQPAERNKYYRVRVRYRNGSTGTITTKQSAWFWW